MSETTPDSVVVTFNLTAADYATYFAVMYGQPSSRTAYIAYFAAFFAAIPVALVSRSLGFHLSNNAATADLIGRIGLVAFLLGVMSLIIAGIVGRQGEIGKLIAGSTDAFGPSTATFDQTGMTVTGSLSQSMWRWAAVKTVTCRGELLLVWTGPLRAVAIPLRCFADAAAFEAARAFIRARLSERHRAGAEAT
jgi:hypothetical protein